VSALFILHNMINNLVTKHHTDKYYEHLQSLAVNDGWIAAKLKPVRLRAYSQIVIKYAFC
jgi:hypothetical protein